MTTVSPVLASPFSSCTMNFDVRRSVLPYRPWRTCHSTATTMLFCIFVLTTTPTFSDFSDMVRLYAPTFGLARRRLARSFLPEHRLHPRQVPADRAEPVGRFELSHRLLNPHPEQLV